MTKKRKGEWMHTFTGVKFYPADPRPEDFNIIDIAHALSNTCRYNGHCRGFYSVAEHSVMVSYDVTSENALWGLLHDASEAYISDIVRPAKIMLPQYKDLEAGIMLAICERFNLNPQMPDEVKRADNNVLAYEAQYLMGVDPKEWGIEPYKGMWNDKGLIIQHYEPSQARKFFLERFKELILNPYSKKGFDL